MLTVGIFFSEYRHTSKDHKGKKSWCERSVNRLQKNKFLHNRIFIKK